MALAARPGACRLGSTAVAVKLAAGHGAQGNRREPRPGRSGILPGPRSASRSSPGAWARDPGWHGRRPGQAGRTRRGHRDPDPDHPRVPGGLAAWPGTSSRRWQRKEHLPGIGGGADSRHAAQRAGHRGRSGCCGEVAGADEDPAAHERSRRQSRITLSGAGGHGERAQSHL